MGAAVAVFGLAFGVRDAEAASLVSSFDPGLTLPVGIAYDDASGNIFVYDQFTTEIREYTPAGVEVAPRIPLTGTASNDFDLDFAPEPLVIGQLTVPANSLLQVNGDDSPDSFQGLDKSTGASLAAVGLSPIGGGDHVGGSWHAGRDTLFGAHYADSTLREFNSSTGAEIAAFPVQPAGSPAFRLFYGDVEVVQSTGNLLVVSSTQNTVRELTPAGAFVRDFDVEPILASGDAMTGIALDESSAHVWISTFNSIYRIDLAGASPPVQGETANLSPVAGTVLVDIPNDGQGFIPIEQVTQIPIGTTVDTTAGRVALTTATTDAGTQTAEFYGGKFKLNQGETSDRATLRLRGRQQCDGGSRSGQTPLASRKRKPKLWGSGSGNFTSQGNHGSASVRGTKWLLFETCGGITGTTVKRGIVAFTDFYTDRTTLVRRGQTALAVPRRRP